MDRLHSLKSAFGYECTLEAGARGAGTGEADPAAVSAGMVVTGFPVTGLITSGTSTPVDGAHPLLTRIRSRSVTEPTP
jgi:hypothetical protein